MQIRDDDHTTTPRTRSADPLAGRIRLARIALSWEKVWPALWPSLAILGAFAVLALFDLLPALPWWAHIPVLAGFVAAVGWSLWRIRGMFAAPSIEAGRRRLEIASGMAHRPLSTLRDNLANGNADLVARSLWETHRARVQAAMRAVRVGIPRPGLTARDPYALRAALLLLLVSGVTIAGGDAIPRLTRAVMPSTGAPVPPGALDLWITPPDYTGLPPLLPRAGAGAITVPTGSALLAQVSGGVTTPRLTVDGVETEFTPVSAAGAAGRAWRVGAKLSAGARIAIQQGRQSLGDWPLKLTPDLPPKVEFTAKPAAEPRGALRFEYAANDDYGVTAVSVTIRLIDAAASAAAIAPIDIVLNNSGAGMRLKTVSGATHQDLTAHPWSGLKVAIQLHATDALGQTGDSEPFETVLPERAFTQPVARAIVDQRRALIAEADSRPAVQRAMGAIASVPNQYNDDTVAYLALTMAAGRLQRDASPDGLDAVQSLMWDTALRVEDGSLSNSERELRALQQQLQDALARNAPDDEIDKLIKELQEAINRYLQAMMENALRNPEQMRPTDPNAMRLSQRDLQQMLDRARQLARTGARDAARDLLSQLQDLLESLKNAQPMVGQQQGGGQQGEGEQMMQGMQDLIQRQQGLLDRTFRRAQPGQGQRSPFGQRGQPGAQGQQPGDQPGTGEGGDGSAEQEGLRRQLGEMMRQFSEMFGNVPGGLGRAEQAMREALESLQQNAPGRAMRSQTEALDQMRSAMRDLAQQFAERFGPGNQNGEGQDDQNLQAQNLDPAGRPRDSNGQGVDRGDIAIPDVIDVQRSREILDELLRRAGERFRPTLERDYIDRLLKRF